MDFEKTLRDACSSEDNPAVAVFQVYTFAHTTDALTGFNDASELLLGADDPLNIFEVGAVEIIPYAVRKASDSNSESTRLLELLGRHGLPKEVLLATDSCLERFVAAEIGEDEEDTEVENPAMHLRSIVQLYSLAFPRLTLRKVPPEEILRLTLLEVVKAYEPLMPQVSDKDGEELLRSFTELTVSLRDWAAKVAEPASEAYQAMMSNLNSSLNIVVSSSMRHILSGLALRAYQVCYPSALAPWRRGASSAIGEAGFKLMQDILVVSDSLGNTFDSRLKATRSDEPAERTASLIFLSHDLERDIPDGTLAITLPAILELILTGSGVDEVLAWLVRCLVAQSHGITDEVASPILSALVNFASMHPDPATRQVALDTISRLIQYTPDETKLQYLSELLLECPYPQMRAAAITLLKTSVIRALDSESSSILASSAVVLLITSVLTPEPPGVLTPELKFPDFVKSRECARLTSALGMLYVVLLRDRTGKLGLRTQSGDAIKRLCLDPLGQSIQRWQAEATDGGDMALYALVSALDRVDDAMKSPSKS